MDVGRDRGNAADRGKVKAVIVAIEATANEKPYVLLNIKPS